MARGEPLASALLEGLPTRNEVATDELESVLRRLVDDARAAWPSVAQALERLHGALELFACLVEPSLAAEHDSVTPVEQALELVVAANPLHDGHALVVRVRGHRRVGLGKAQIEEEILSRVHTGWIVARGVGRSHGAVIVFDRS